MPLVNGTGNTPSPGRPTPGVVKQDKSSGGSVDTTKTRSGLQRVRMCNGEGPIGAAQGKQSETEALCQPPALGGGGVRAGGSIRGQKKSLYPQLASNFRIFSAFLQSPPPPPREIVPVDG